MRTSTAVVLRHPSCGRSSLVPDEVRLSIFTLLPAQYMDPFRVRDPACDPGRAINRAQIELLAARVSVLSQCFY